jgi:hypothetical protein
VITGGRYVDRLLRYVDRLLRYQDEWRIVRRTVLIDRSRDLGRPVPWPALAATAFAPGRQDGNDVAQLARAEMARLRSSLTEEPLARPRERVKIFQRQC